MNLDRMKFAWARGARLLFKGIGVDSAPCNAGIFDSSGAWRLLIHPDDAHLEYGPISGALRNAAITNEYAWNSRLTAAEAFYMDELEGQPGPWLSTMWPHPDSDDRRLLQLFLAEYLADQGL